MDSLSVDSRFSLPDNQVYCRSMVKSIALRKLLLLLIAVLKLATEIDVSVHIKLVHIHRLTITSSRTWGRFSASLNLFHLM